MVRMGNMGSLVVMPVSAIVFFTLLSDHCFNNYISFNIII